MLILLKINKIDIKYTQSELIELGLNVASGKLSEANIREWILSHKVISLHKIL